LTEFTVEKESGPTRGRFVIRHEGAEAELTFSVTTPTLIIADHTGVPDAFRGMGAGLQLVEALVADARANGYKVMPLCPFVNATSKKHPEWADVFAV
jgi:predicted GNAT family acetyltransferase